MGVNSNIINDIHLKVANYIMSFKLSEDNFNIKDCPMKLKTLLAFQ
jgi:hypothetical protein